MEGGEQLSPFYFPHCTIATLDPDLSEDFIPLLFISGQFGNS